MTDDPFAQMQALLDAPKPSPEAQRVEQALRWRLVLGRFADDQLGFGRLAGMGGSGAGGLELAGMIDEAQQIDVPLSYIYDREHTDRMQRQSGPGGGSGLTVPVWINQVRRLFPKEAARVIEKDALVRYGLHELVTDAKVLREAEPTEDLLHAIVNFKHLMKGPVLKEARRIIDAVVKQMSARLETACRPALHGPRGRGDRPPIRTHQNVDWHRTIRRNLKNFDQDRERLIADRMTYSHRQRAHSKWRIIIAVDQSGSMTDSLIHSAVMAGIFSQLPSLDVRLVLWDHRVMDVSHLADDPLEVLMSCQLGGGTQLGPALSYCSGLITDPRRTIFVLISDWYIWGEAAQCLAVAKSMQESGVHGIGLSALDAECRPVYDEDFARKLAGCGWFVAALTPKKLAEHIGQVIA